MLKEPERHIRALMEHMYGKEQVVKLKPIKWEEVGVKVYASMWTEMVQEHAKWLGTLTADQIPSDKKWFIKKGAELAKMHNQPDAVADNTLNTRSTCCSAPSARRRCEQVGRSTPRLAVRSRCAEATPASSRIWRSTSSLMVR